MPSFAVTQTNLIDSVNYLIAGPQTVGQETKGYWNFGGGYLTGFNTPPFLQDDQPPPPIYTQPALDDYKYLNTPAYVTVKTTSSTDSVIVTGQFRPFAKVTNTIASTWNFYINVYRYKLINTSTPWFAGYINYSNIAQDNNAFNTATIDPLVQSGDRSWGETIFASIVDTPDVGYYAYVLDVEYRPRTGDPVLEWVYGENIGITAAVIKI